MVNLCVKKKIFAVFMTAIILLSTVSVTVSAYNSDFFMDKRETVIDGVVIKYAVTNSPPYFLGDTFEKPVAVIFNFRATSDFDGYLNIPSEIDDYTVFSIIAYDGSIENSMKSNTNTGTYHIEIPDSVKYIENGAFKNFKYLESIKMPITDTKTYSYGVYATPSYAFEECEQLRSVVLTNPEQKPYTIGLQCFYGCFNLKSVILPEGLKSIRAEAFAGCRSLKEINLPEGLTTIGNSAFSRTGLMSIDLPDSVTNIGINAFRSNENLATVNNFSDRIDVSFSAFHGTAIFNDKSNWDDDKCYLGDTFIYWSNSQNNNGEVFIKEGTKRIAMDALISGYSMKKVTVHIPSSVEYIPSVNLRNTDTEELCIIYEGTKDMWDSIAPEHGFNAKTIKSIFLGDIVFGDLDGDGIITLKDTCRMKALILFAYEPTALEKAAADMNGDGVINTRDSFLLKRALLLGE